MDYTKTTLGELLTSDNKIVYRNAMSILKELRESDYTPLNQRSKKCNHAGLYEWIGDTEGPDAYRVCLNCRKELD